jgi:hypothetical protein
MKPLLVLALGLSAVGLSGCLISQIHNSPDFGQAVHQNVMAQITNPDPRYPGPPPPSNGPRAALAQYRYRTGTTIPAVATASTIGDVNGAAPPPAPAPPAGGATGP